MNEENAVKKMLAETLADWRKKEIESLRRQRDDSERIVRESRAAIDRELSRADQLTGAISALEAEGRVYAQAVAQMEGGPVAASAQPESVDDNPEEGMKEHAAAASAATKKRLEAAAEAFMADSPDPTSKAGA
jgi:hypothetical protein